MVTPGITVSVPDDDERQLLLDRIGDRDVEVLVWDGTGPAPDGAERIELFVGATYAPPPAASTLAALPRLKAVQIKSAGVDPWLPVVPEQAVLCNSRGIHGSSTAELAVAGMLAVIRELPAYLDDQRAHRTQKRDSRGLAGLHVLVLGAGDIGRRIGDIATVLDAEVTYVARTARDGIRTFADLPELLPRHEVVVLAIPLTSETEGIVDAAFLAAMPDRAVLVNVSRGKHVDTDALLAESPRLQAFLDVTDPEPLPADHPLWDAPNVVLTPHVGGGMVGWVGRAYDLIAEQVRALRDGTELRNVVTGDY